MFENFAPSRPFIILQKQLLLKQIVDNSNQLKRPSIPLLQFPKGQTYGNRELRTHGGKNLIQKRRSAGFGKGVTDLYFRSEIRGGGFFENLETSPATGEYDLAYGLVVFPFISHDRVI